jgi:hypothetical protein
MAIGELEKIGSEVFAVCLKILSRNSPGRIEKHLRIVDVLVETRTENIPSVSQKNFPLEPTCSVLLRLITLINIWQIAQIRKLLVM